jgi:hypothetical protein
MKKEFILSKIEMVHDGSPYVYPFGPKAMAFTSPEDLMKNLPKAMGNITGMMGGAGLGDSLTFKLSMREYEDMGLKVGDRVSIEITKKQDSGI